MSGDSRRYWAWKYAGVLRHVRQRVVDLVVERHVLVVEVLHRDLGALAEGHRPVGVERAARIDADGERVDLGVFAPAAGEEMAHRHFHGRRRLAIPIEAQDVKLRLVERGGCHPDLLDHAGAVDLAHGEGGFGGDPHRRGNLPASAQVTRGILAGAFRGHGGFALFAGEILRADRAALGVRQPGQTGQIHAQAIVLPAPAKGLAVAPRQIDQRTDRQGQHQELRLTPTPRDSPTPFHLPALSMSRVSFATNTLSFVILSEAKDLLFVGRASSHNVFRRAGTLALRRDASLRSA